ncbi:TetR/AcrR family transcriptional regulator [Micromonospora sp. LOL_013]|uniref:TetR/AcrR family transcriptional regulator n=1 Tax=Micromonospora sp. LOL_013 TaxID=3345414 RepID=UPI003A89DCD0
MASGQNRGGAAAPSFEFLWRDTRAPRSGPGPKPALSVDKIVLTAIEIADEEGLDAVSMQQVAKRLDFTAMSLYRYVPSKSHLVDAMTDVASGDPPDLDAVTGGWQAKVETWVKAIWGRYQHHPWMLQVRVSYPIGPNQLAWFESLLGAIADSGLGYDEMVSVSLFLSGATQGMARISLDMAPAGAEPTSGGLGYEQALATVVDAERFPTLARLLAAGTFATPAAPTGPDSDVIPNLEFGLRQLLEGIHVYLTRRTQLGADRG